MWCDINILFSRNYFVGVKDNVPPSSPTIHQLSPSPTVQKRVRMSDGDVSRVLNSTPPLPPISTSSRGRQSPDGGYQYKVLFYIKKDHIGGVMVSMLSSSLVDRVFEPWSRQTKDYEIGICCFSAKHAALRRKSKDWLAWNQNSVQHVYPLTVVSVS